MGSATATPPAEVKYIDAASTGELHLQKQSQYNLPTVSSDDMVWLYENKLAAKGSPGRVIYDKIFVSVRNGMCSLCGAAPASSLDHYFPKTKFPALAVSPANLIPVCQGCNHAKGSFVAGRVEDLPVHPYFDNFNDGVWLVAVVGEEAVAVTFHAVPPDSWPKDRAAKIFRHFDSLGLAAAYGSYASQAIQGIQYDRICRSQTPGFSHGVRPSDRDVTH